MDPPEAEVVTRFGPTEADWVIPKLEAVVVGRVTRGVVEELVPAEPLTVPVPVVTAVVEAEVEVVTVAPTEKSGVSEYTCPILPILTAWIVYCAPGGTMGSVTVIWPEVGSTLFAIAIALLKDGLVSSRENVEGSPAVLVHFITQLPPEVGFVGASRVRPATRGTRSARRLSLLNIFYGRGRKKRRLL